jgi:dissimilatory sulfite reductase (desulfoviridin) alpha/beta subunit
MMLEQIERKLKKLQEAKKMQTEMKPGSTSKQPKIKGLTQTLGVHNCPVSLVESLGAIARAESAVLGRKVPVGEVVVRLLEAAVKAEGL